jgi:glycerophosphoryl diester phosphodiesterase
VGVWLERKDTKETDELYQQLLDLKIDFLYADHPLQAMRIKKKYYLDQG